FFRYKWNGFCCGSLGCLWSRWSTRKKTCWPYFSYAKFDEWTTVDLTEHQIEVDGDFYMVYVQMMDYPVAPGLGTDDGNPYTHRSYQYLDGKFYPAFEDDGNYMIRSKVSYEIESPV